MQRNDCPKFSSRRCLSQDRLHNPIVYVAFPPARCPRAFRFPTQLHEIKQSPIPSAVSRIMMYHYPALIPHVRHSGRRAGPAQFAPQRHPQAHLPPVTPEMMKVHNRLWETILRHPNPIEAMNQCMELLTDDVEDFQRPQNEVEEEQNGREGGQQGGHVVGPEPGEDGGMPPQDPPPAWVRRTCQRHCARRWDVGRFATRDAAAVPWSWRWLLLCASTVWPTMK
jgi:hypothetical protein